MINFPNAKINIGLSITSHRPDNYHNLETIFYPICIKDVLEIVESKKLAFSSSGLSIPGNEVDNLCLKAYHLIKQDISLPPVHIHLHKHIPIGAGLGGGSSDAAFCIKLFDAKFSLNLSSKQMEHYAKQLGADCAFFIRNETVLATEKGDQFQPFNLTLKNYHIIVVVPPIHVSTKEAYNDIIPSKLNSSITKSSLLPIEKWKQTIKNDFEITVFKKYPAIETIKNTLYEAGALYASMSGSGSSIYGIFKNKIKLPALEKNNQVFYDV